MLNYDGHGRSSGGNLLDVQSLMTSKGEIHAQVGGMTRVWGSGAMETNQRAHDTRIHHNGVRDSLPLYLKRSTKCMCGIMLPAPCLSYGLV